MLDTARPDSRVRTHADYYARWAGLAVGVVAAPLWATLDISAFGNDFGFNVPLVGGVMAFGLCVVGGVLLGDALTPRPREAIRIAGLAPRRVRDHVPPRMTRLLLFEAVFLVGLVGIGAAASPSTVDRAIQVLVAECDGVTGPPVSLWPGMFYGSQILASFAIGTVACAWALRRIAHRPGDDQQRRDRSLAITAAWGVLVSTQLVVDLLFIDSFLRHGNCAAGTLGTVTAVVIYPLGVLGLVTLAWSLFTVVVPRAARR